MLDIDVEAYYREQDLRMSIPDDDEDEFIQRLAESRQPAERDRTSFRVANNRSKGTRFSPAFRADMEMETNEDTVPALLSSFRRLPEIPLSEDRSRKRKRDETESGTSLRQYFRSSRYLRHTSPLRMKETPLDVTEPQLAVTDTKVDVALADQSNDLSTDGSSPARKAPTSEARKPASTRRLEKRFGKPPDLKIPTEILPPTIDLTSSPIEEPDFSVLVSRFEPQAQSTQRPLAANASMHFLQMKERVENVKRLKLEKKLRKEASKAKASAAASGDESAIESVSSSSSRPSSPAPQPKTVAPGKDKGKAKALPDLPKKAAPPAKKGKKVKMMPMDYAQMVKERAEAPLPPGTKRPRGDRILKGKRIFFTGGDMNFASDATMGRMDIIVKLGGTLCPKFDPAVVTHIITEAAEKSTLRALGVTAFEEIPEHIPIVRWSWVFKSASLDDATPFSAFPGRWPRPVVKVQGMEAKRASSSSVSVSTSDRVLGRALMSGGRKRDRAGGLPKRNIHDSEESEDETPVAGPSTSRPETPTNPDPLAGFYAQAKEEFDRENAEQPVPTEDDSGTDDDEKPGPSKKRGWTCDSRQNMRKDGPNEFVAQKLEELKELHAAKAGDDDRWRVFAYRKAIPALRNYHKRIESLEEARCIQGVGDKTAIKIMEIVETGDLRRIKYENTEDVQIRKLFQGIYGVGQATALRWYTFGCRTLDDVRAGKGGVVLTPAQKIGLEFYDDINARMPREEAQAIFQLIKPIALRIDPKLEVHIMGSFRRGKATCGDIDIMITRCPDDGRTIAGLLHELLRILHKKKIITEHLAMPEDPHDEEAIYRGLCRLQEPGSRRRRIDFLTVPWKSRGAALLYYTGDDIFNRAMRLKANHLGYSLNQKGLYAGVVRDPKNRMVKLNAGNIVASETEEEIFRILDVPYQEPHERVRS